MKLYAITADYRPNNPKKPVYYVKAKNKLEAKRKFEFYCSWLKVYEVKKLAEEDAQKIIDDGPYKHIVF